MASDATIQVRIVKNGGPITRDVYKSYYDNGGSANEDWNSGEFLHLSATGVLARSDAAEGSGQFGTEVALDNDAPWDAAKRWFLALEDHDSDIWGRASGSNDKGDACAESQYVAVQEITADTVFEIQIADGSTGVPSCANVLQGVDGYGAWVSAGAVWGLDANDASNGMFVVVAKSTDYAWMESEKFTTPAQDTDGSGSLVYARLVGNIIL